MKLAISRRSALAGLMASAAAPAFADTAQTRAVVWSPEPDIIVARDGSGQFTSIQEAVQSIPKDNRERKIILIRNGAYDEVVRVDAAYVTLRGQSRLGTRLQSNRPADLPRDELGQGVLNISATAHDFVLENMTVHNTVEAIGPHAFAIFGRADRTIIQNADVLSLGADTLSLWRGIKGSDEAGLSEGPGATPLTADGGRYYHTGLRVMGSVDFVCPRGWCFLSNSQIVQVNPATTAAFWHEGMRVEDKKFVIKGCEVDGPPDFFLARHHRDAQFYFIDCAFSERMRDKPPYLVVYPIAGGVPTPEDLARNRQATDEGRWGERSYFHNSHRVGGDYGWLSDTLTSAKGAPRPDDITAKWTFDGTWDPERTDGPKVIAVTSGPKGLRVEFDRLVTVKGTPELVFSNDERSDFMTGSGSAALTFASPRARRAQARALSFDHGAVVQTEGVGALVLASSALGSGPIDVRRSI
jgi:pectinesterase